MNGINRRQLIQGGVYAALTGVLCRGGWSSRAAAASSFIPFFLHIHVSGGWDTTMVFENKIGQSYVSQETGAVVATGAGNIPYIDHANRPAVKTFFDTFGSNAAIVNGVSVGGIDRVQAMQNIMGCKAPARTRYTDWLSFYTYSTNPVMSMPHVVIDAPWLPGDYSAVAVRLTSKAITEYSTPIDGAELLGADGERALAAFRKEAYGKFYSAANEKSLDGDKLKALFYSSARESNAYTDVAKAQTTLGDLSADSDFLKKGKLAVELFAQNSSQAVTVQSGPDNEWDTTTDNFARQAVKYQELFAGINAIISYANTRGVANKMIIMVTSERARAPRLNTVGGKFAWPFTSVLLWGVGINGGAVAGLTDPALRGLPIDPIFGGQSDKAPPLEMGNIISAIYLKNNIPTKLLLPDHKPLSPILLAADS